MQNEFDKLVHSTSIPLEVPMGMSRQALREKLIERLQKTNHKGSRAILSERGGGKFTKRELENLDLENF